MKKAVKFFDNINHKICYASMGAAFFLMCMTTVHAIIRKFTNSGGITDSLGITEITMVVIVFCAFAYMESQHGHVRVTVLADLFPKKQGTGLHGVMLVITGLFLFTIFYAVMIYLPIVSSRGPTTLMLKIPIWPFYIVIAVGLFVYAVTVLLHGFEKFMEIKTITNKTEGDEVEAVDVTAQM